jgi:hypothetical protein
MSCSAEHIGFFDCGQRFVEEVMPYLHGSQCKSRTSGSLLRESTSLGCVLL